jgi:serine/threonine protein kinase
MSELKLGDADGVPRVDEITIPFGDIQFEKKIGKGAFGEVWKAQYLGTDVAVKKMFQPEDAWVRKLIKREIEALRCVHVIPPHLADTKIPQCYYHQQFLIFPDEFPTW